MRFKLFVVILAISIVLINCQSKTEQTSKEKLAPGIHKAVVDEVIQANQYTYLKVSENGKENWLAIAKKDLNEGDVLYYASGLEMKDFESKELNKTFDTIYFVSQISDKPIMMTQGNMEKFHPGNKKTKMKEGISITPAKDGITIAELFSNKDKYAGKSVKVKGQVIKYYPEIMGKNWVHLQDGTRYENNYDLTVTTNDVVKTGDVVTFEGKIALNKNLGTGYSYEVIMEQAKKESTINM